MHTYPEEQSFVSKLPKGWPSLILFGDSITERIWRQGVDNHGGFSFGAALSEAFSRRLQIVERGFSGYNTANARVIFEDVIPKAGGQVDLKLLVIFFGANDAVLPGRHQHCELTAYKENLKALVEHQIVKDHGAKVVIVAPPPYDEHKSNFTDRRAEITKQYADAAAEVGSETGAEVLNLWEIYMHYCGWKEGDPLLGDIKNPRCPGLDDLLCDGLHLNAKSYQMYFEHLMALLREKLPEIYYARKLFPNWPEAPRNDE